MTDHSTITGTKLVRKYTFGGERPRFVNTRWWSWWMGSTGAIIWIWLVGVLLQMTCSQGLVVLSTGELWIGLWMR